MNRRGFFGMVAAVVGSRVAPTATAPDEPTVTVAMDIDGRVLAERVVQMIEDNENESGAAARLRMAMRERD